MRIEKSTLESQKRRERFEGFVIALVSFFFFFFFRQREREREKERCLFECAKEEMGWGEKNVLAKGPAKTKGMERK